MSEQRDELRRRKLMRAQCKATITRIANFVGDPVAFASATVDILEARRAKLMDALKEYESAQLDILAIDDKDPEKVGEVEEKYFSVLAEINAALKRISSVKVSECHNVSTCKLPTIDITPYDGKDFTKFKAFYELFTAIIDNNTTLSDVQKLFYLRKYVTGDALAVIVNLPLVNQSYKEALSLLTKRFDNKARLITNHVNIILDLPSIGKGTAASIRSFISDVQQQLHALKNLSEPVDKWDMLLIPILSRKLDHFTHRAYHLDRDSEKMPTIPEFISFLEKRAIALEDSLPMFSTSDQKFKKVTNVAAQTKLCKFCNNTNHLLYSCPKFQTAALLERQQFVRDHELCHVCLKPHSGKCTYNFKCKICKNPSHNSLLHSEPTAKQAEPVTLLSSPTKCNVLLPTVQVHVIDHSGKAMTVRGLLDSGSQVSFATTSLVKRLGLTSISQTNKIIGIGNKPTQINKIVNLNVLPTNNNKIKFNLDCHIVDSITTNLPQQFINTTNWKIPEHVELSDRNFNVPSEISLLLGSDVYFNILLDGCIKLHNGPVLQNTIFGYVIGGNIPVGGCFERNSCHLVTNFAINDHNKLENIMENFWLAERIPEPVKPQCDEFLMAEEVFQSSMRLENDRFQVDMPLAAPLEELQLGNSFSIAYQRFITLEKRFKKDPMLLEQYKLFIKQYVERGYASAVDIGNYDINNDSVYFLAHHAVLNESSKTTKLRVVFDGSMRSQNQVSLNSVMLNGPVVQSELFFILILFRTYLFTLISDIQRMFNQIKINEHQRCLQNILWRDDPSQPITCLQLQTVTYGLKASTFLATRCLIELAQRYKDRYPLAAQAMFNNTFVDDVLCGSDKVEQLHELKNQLVGLLKLGSFSLHKWCSNSPEVLKDIPDELKQFENIDMSKSNFVKTLGLMYDITSDTFAFSSPELNEENNINTKRKILSFIGKMFDPLGLVGPIIVVAKIFMQTLWSMQVDWDATLPNEQLIYWAKFLSNLKEMGKLTVNRCVNDNDSSSIELVGYSDASIKAFGCCLYSRIIRNNGTVQVELLCSKSRVSPLGRSLTIPQLELNSSLLLSQLAHKVGNVLKDRFPSMKTYLYSDSQIVLAWIKSSHVASNVYANNRIKQILELSDKVQWGFVRTKDNPADLLSRGVMPHKLQQNSLWWHGPTYLSDKSFIHTGLDNIQMPIDHKPMLNSDQSYQCNLVETIEPSFATKLFERFSDMNKLQRIIAYIYRFFNNCTKNNTKIVEPTLTPKELHGATSVIVRCTQRAYFSKEIEALSTGKNIKSSIANLHPFLDKIGVLRVGGRLSNSTSLSYDKKHPVILPKGCHVTYLLIGREHLRLLHAGPRLVLSSLSQSYSIVSGIREVKKVVRKCVKCFRMKAEAAKQLMGSYPIERITAASRVFQVVGLDFCGSFDLKVARVRKPMTMKCYVAVFVDFAVKAIHLELVGSLTTQNFLACLQRFISRRAMPKTIFCDNAKTFHGASNVMKQLYELQCSKEHRNAVDRFCANNYIEFKFIPSYSPEFGGLWESNVKSFKHHFKRVVGNLSLTYEEMYTVIVQIEGILNSRPLIAANSVDCQYLTPAHFLCGTAITNYAEQDLAEVPAHRLKFWNLCTKIKQDFWKVWSNDYLTQLQSRPKWKHVQPDLKEGDLVIVKDLNTAPLNWPMARIVKTYPGRDSRVRVADIKINNKIYRRSIKRLCPLPIS